MKKPIIIAVVTVLLIASGGAAYYFLATKPAAGGSSTVAAELTAAQEQGQPTRAAEIKGIVTSVEGNEIVVANEINTVELTDEEKAAQKAARQALSQEERQALKAEETAAAEVKSTAVTIPVGIKLMKSTGDATGELVAAEIADVTVGVYVSVWVKDYQMDTAEVEFVKVRQATE